MIAAGHAAKDKGPLPPQLWKAQHSQQPTWAELDQMKYREVATLTALQNIYTVVSAWRAGKAKDPRVMKYYTELVKAGIVGKDI